MSRFWKEASSVIVAARISFPQCTVSYPVHTANRPNKNAVLTQKIESERLCSPNFKVLALRRSSKNSFFPDSYVFPGGNTDAADSSHEWLDLYDQYGLGKYVFEIAASLPRQYSKISIFEGQREDEILKSISLRITGIRETFEESGVLLCKSKRAHASHPSRWASYLSGHEIKNWQRKVQEDANEFISLCRHFECYPDIWSLQEWSNWLTPSDYTKRFNTIFFLTTLDQMPTAASSSDEINELKVHIFSQSCFKYGNVSILDVVFGDGRNERSEILCAIQMDPQSYPVSCTFGIGSGWSVVLTTNLFLALRCKCLRSACQNISWGDLDPLQF